MSVNPSKRYQIQLQKLSWIMSDVVLIKLILDLINRYHHIIHTLSCTMIYSSSPFARQESDVPSCFGIIRSVMTNFPWRILPVRKPHVSTLFSVFLSAQRKKVVIRSPGITTSRRPEFIGDKNLFGFVVRSKPGWFWDDGGETVTPDPGTDCSIRRSAIISV